jgi:asparagine synthase (glutamine-hydrolysing)
MCGIAGIFGSELNPTQLRAMVASQHHRGPDADGLYVDAVGGAALGHNRLSIIDLSEAGRQPMSDAAAQYWLVFNGEIYNYLELRRELSAEYEFRTRTDTEVLLAAYRKWGAACLDKLIGMFAFVIWDEQTQTAFAARDRFGVKPLYYHHGPGGALAIVSEIKALHAAGVGTEADEITWATYLTYGLHDHSERTFWSGIKSLPPGHTLTWHQGRLNIACWYDLASRVAAEFDERPLETVQEEYLSLLTESVRLRFRSDVPVGINLSGGVDSSTLLGLVQEVQGPQSDVKVFTFTTGDPDYDELPWVRQMLERTQHPLTICELQAAAVPALAQSVQAHQDEPFGGLPTLAYARLFEMARREGVIVLLDGQGLDEQWAGYEYYLAAFDGRAASIVQGVKECPVRPECLTPEFRQLAEPFAAGTPFFDRLRNLQYRDARYTKIPRALRFNDRVSMRSSTELREPFLDHRLFEIALGQPPERKIMGDTRKWLLREIARHMLPGGVVEAPKRPLQTPQREWLRGPLRDWASDCIKRALQEAGGGWLKRDAVLATWRDYCAGAGDNSFYVWQWINLGLMSEKMAAVTYA